MARVLMASLQLMRTRGSHGVGDVGNDSINQIIGLSTEGEQSFLISHLIDEEHMRGSIQYRR
jgi:hypothetical protein